MRAAKERTSISGALKGFFLRRVGIGKGLGPRLGAVGPPAAEAISSPLRAWTLPRPGTMY